jgi:hypothetical protein
MKLISKAKIRQIHAQFAPIMIFPLLLTLVTGSLFQIATLTGDANKFYWLLELHTGKFGRFDLGFIYPFLNAFGLLMLLVTGITMWLKIRSPKSLNR